MKNLLFILSTMFLLSSCDEEKRKNIIILIDNSKTVSDETFNNYLNVIERSVFTNLSPKDIITIQFIDECSKTKAERIFHLSLNEQKFENKNDGSLYSADSINARKNRFLASKIITFRETVLSKKMTRSECNNFTDILGSLENIKLLLNDDKTFKTENDKIKNTVIGEDNYSYQNFVLIFSDMINESSDLNFNKHLISNDQIVELATEKTKFLNYDLYMVIVYGMSAPSAKTNDNISLFWNTYFEKCSKNSIIAYDTELEINKTLKNK